MEALANQQAVREVLVEETEFEHIVWPYRLMVPVLYIVGAYVKAKKVICKSFGWPLPKTNFWLIDGISINSRRVKDGAATWRALDAVYNFTAGEGDTWLARVIDRYWLKIRNAQAVRNRLKIVKRELLAAVFRMSKGAPIRILSLAAGSGQGVIEVVASLRRIGIRCDVLLIDQDASALAHARMLMERHGVSDSVRLRQADVIYFEREVRKEDFKPDIIEMCGLMDYLLDPLAVVLIKKIHRRLQLNGFFLTCHIHPNHEAYFLWHQENWGMLYRTRRQLRELLIEGGFLEADLYAEPHRIHSVAVTQKL